MQRTLHDRLRLHPSRPLQLAAAPVSAAAAGALVYFWSLSAPFLIRPRWTGVFPLDWFIAESTYQAMLMQRLDWQLGLIAVGLSLLIALTVQRWANLGLDAIIAAAPVSQVEPGAPRWLRLAARGFVIIVLASGMFSGWLDLLLIISALIGSELLVAMLSNRAEYSTRLLAIPAWLRVAVAMACTFGLSTIVLFAYYRPLADSTFFPIVLGFGLSLIIYRLLLDVEQPAHFSDSAEDSSEPPAGASESIPDSKRSAAPARIPVSSILPIVLLTVWFVLAFSDIAFADNCSGLEDCETAGKGKIRAAVGAAAGFAWGIVKGAFSKTPTPIAALEPLASEEGAAAQKGAFQMTQAVAANRALAKGDTEGYYAIRGMSPAEFQQRALNGEFKP